MERRPRDDRRRRDSHDKPPRRDHRPAKDSNQPPRQHNRDRSRSPARRDRRDDKRRDRSPPRGPARGGHSNRGQRDQGRGHGHSDRGPPRQPFDSRTANNAPSGRKPAPPKEKAQQILEGEDSDTAMERIMGFKGFRSTQNTKVPGNEKNYGVNKRKKTEYRQYMNRVGGFNRPLSPSRA